MWSEPLRAVFAERAFARVQFCIDSVPDVQGQKSPWRVRKDSYLEYPRKVEGEAGILVSSCDKLANLLAILLDLTETGEAVRARLKGGKGGSLSYYSELASMFSGKVLLPVEEALKRDLAAVLERLQPAETWEFLGDSVFVIHVFFITFADDCIHAGGSDVGRVSTALSAMLTAVALTDTAAPATVTKAHP